MTGELPKGDNDNTNQDDDLMDKIMNSPVVDAGAEEETAPQVIPTEGLKLANETLSALNEQLLQQLSIASINIARLTQEKQELQDRLEAQKQEAEDSYARLQKSIEEIKKTAMAPFAQATIPVADTLEQALEFISAVDRAHDAKLDSLAKGVELTARRLTAIFNKFGIIQINPAKGEIFDYNIHDAASCVPCAEGVQPDTVVTVQQKGYAVVDGDKTDAQGKPVIKKLLRPARVVVAE